MKTKLGCLIVTTDGINKLPLFTFLCINNIGEGRQEVTGITVGTVFVVVDELLSVCLLHNSHYLRTCIVSVEL